MDIDYLVAIYIGGMIYRHLRKQIISFRTAISSIGKAEDWLIFIGNSLLVSFQEAVFIYFVI